ncbi:MAG: glycosyltransferase [Parabacteroides sp.]|nr:glycosyltransferase [Parabacteroides sp.]
MIKAVALLKEKGITDISVDFIGTGESEATLKRLVKTLGVEEQVRFLGLRSRRYIYSCLKEYDLMCHPARYEGFGLTVAEGMAARLPVLVSTGGGPYEIIAQGRLGYAFENGNPQDCADKIEAIYNDYPAILEGTDRAWKHIITHYSVKRMVNEYMHAYLRGDTSTDL